MSIYLINNNDTWLCYISNQISVMSLQIYRHSPVRKMQLLLAKADMSIYLINNNDTWLCYISNQISVMSLQIYRHSPVRKMQLLLRKHRAGQ